MSTFKPLSYTHDLSREEIIDRFRDRIAQGKRSKLRGDELNQLILYFVERLQQLDSEPEIRALCAAEINLLEEGYPQATLASDYLSKYRQALQQAIQDGVVPLTAHNSHRYTHIQRVTGEETQRFEHYALTYLKYDSQTYEALDRRQALTNRKHQLNLLSVNPNHYLAKLKELLHSGDKFAARHQAIALAGLTGRRIGEVLARGKFLTASHPYLLRFTGHQKTQRSAYDIVTLLPAAEVLVQIKHFRTQAQIQPLLNLEGEELTKALNQMDVQVNRECHKHLAEIVPALADRDRVSVHNLRSVWGALVVWLFCPPNQHEYPFIQHYLGHVLESSATGHYFRYQLVDDTGQMLKDKGIRLSEVGELPLWEDEVENTITATSPTEAEATPDASPRLKLSKLRYYHRDRQRWTHLLDTLCPHCHNQQEKSAALLLWAEQQQKQPKSVAEGKPEEPALTPGLAQPQLQLEPTPTEVSLDATVAQTVADQARTLAWLTTKIEQLEAEVFELRQQRDWATGQLEQLKLQPQLQLEIAQLKAENLQLRQAHLRYEAVRRALLGNDSDAIASVSSSPDSKSASPEESADSTPAVAISPSQPTDLSASRVVPNVNLSKSTARCNASGWYQPDSRRAPSQGSNPIDPSARCNAASNAFEASSERYKHNQGAALSRPPFNGGHSDAAVDLDKSFKPFEPNSVTTAAGSNSQGSVGELSAELTPPHAAKTSDRSSGGGGAKGRAHRIFTMIQTWNQQHPHNTFAITTGLLENTFGINRKAAKEFYQEFQQPIGLHHQLIGVENERSHNRGKDVSLLRSFVESGGSITYPPSDPTASNERIEQAVQAIMNYNDYTATEKNQKWAITPDAVVQLSGCDLDSINNFLQEHHLAIADHHAKHQLSPNHNSSQTNKGKKIHDCIRSD